MFLLLERYTKALVKARRGWYIAAVDRYRFSLCLLSALLLSGCSNQYEQALQEGDDLLQRHPGRALSAYRRALTLNSNSRTLLRIGRALERLGKTKQALASLSNAMEGPGRKKQAKLRYRVARLLEKQGSAQAAARIYAALAKADPPHGPAALRYAQYLMQQDRHAEARRLLQRLLKTKPQPALRTRALRLLSVLP